MAVSDGTVQFLQWVVFVGLLSLNGVYCQICKEQYGETPSIYMCVDHSNVTGSPGQAIYLDSSGAPTLTNVECKCKLEFSATTSVTISYRAQNDHASGCGITFRLENSVEPEEWGCQTTNITYTISQKENNMTYIKNNSDEQNWYSCLGIRAASNQVSLSVTCYAARTIYGPNDIVNGGWATWNSWSPCSASCGNGSRSRTRTCSDPEPMNGGLPCQGSDNETESCSLQACTVNGMWGTWSVWGLCSQTCGGGKQLRTRECDSPAPLNGGQTCAGNSTETRSCNIQTCSADGMWGEWSVWDSCSQTCGGGTQERTRKCDNPAPQNGGLECSDNSTDTQQCNMPACPADSVSHSTPSTSSTSAKGPATQAVIDVAVASSNLGAIIGGVIGGLLFLLLLILLIICLVRRRRRKKETKRRPSLGPRSVRYLSSGDDVTVTENELYNYDGETPSHAVNALFVGGIPETPSSPGYIPHFSTDTGDRYAVIVDSTKTKHKGKDRPKLDTFAPVKRDAHISNGDVRASTDTVKLAENYSDDNLGGGVENPGYDGNYLAPYNERGPKSSSSSTSPYDYIDSEKLRRDDEEFENMTGDYARLPEHIETDNPDNFPSDKTDEPDSERYKRFINSDSEESPSGGYLTSPKRDAKFEFPDVQ